MADGRERQLEIAARARFRSPALHDRRCRRRAGRSSRFATPAGACRAVSRGVRRRVWATPRAVVYFTPTTVIAPAAPSPRGRRWPESRAALARRVAPLSTAGTMPRCTSVTSSRVSRSAGKAWFASAMKASTSATVTAAASGCDERLPTGWCRRWPARAREPASASVRSTVGAASAMSLAGFDVTRFIALSSGKRRATPNGAHDCRRPRRRQR